MQKKPFSGKTLRLVFGIIAAIVFLVSLVSYFVMSAQASLPKDDPNYVMIPPYLVALPGDIAIITGAAALFHLLFAGLAKKGKAANWVSLASSIALIGLSLGLGFSLGLMDDGAFQGGNIVLILFPTIIGLIFAIPLLIGSIMGIRYAGVIAPGEEKDIEAEERRARHDEERKERIERAERLAKGTVPEGESKFIGNGLELWGWSLLGTLVTICTCGICLPIAVNWIYRYKTEHMLVSGRKLVWHGTAAGLFGNWIKWLLLTIVTCGIYGLWVEKRLLQWKARNTSYEGCPVGSEEDGDYDGSVLGLFLVRLASGLLTLITCGIYSPWAYARITRYQMEHTKYAGMRVAFEGSGGDYFLTWLKSILLSLITCGLYAIIKCPILSWIAENTYFERPE